MDLMKFVRRDEPLTLADVLEYVAGLEARIDCLVARVDELENPDVPRCPHCGGAELEDASTMGSEPESRFACVGEDGCGRIFEVSEIENG